MDIFLYVIAIVTIAVLLAFYYYYFPRVSHKVCTLLGIKPHSRIEFVSVRQTIKATLLFMVVLIAIGVVGLICYFLFGLFLVFVFTKNL